MKIQLLTGLLASALVSSCALPHPGTRPHHSRHHSKSKTPPVVKPVTPAKTTTPAS